MSATHVLPHEERAPSIALSHATILRFFWPLAVSWIFMSVESPVSVALISRLPNAEINTAAFLLMMGLAMWIESPVIDLLSTSTTLARTRQNYVQLSQFTWWVIAWVTLAHAILVFTPIYGFVAARLIGAPLAVAEQARLGLAMMLPWSGLIGWRRYLQGILIRNGRTSLIGYGTATRVATMFASGLLLFLTTALPGIQIAGIALVCAVFAESVFIHLASRPVIRAAFLSQTDGEPISMRKLVRFHFPLSATTMVVMLTMPILSWALSHSQDSVSQLAGFQVAFTLVWLMRTVTYALPEVVITLYRDATSAAILRSFCLRVGLACSAIMLALWATGIDEFFFAKILGATPSETQIGHVAFLTPVLVPLVNALQSYVRGMLTAHHLTVSRLLAIAAQVCVLFACLSLGILLHVTGVVATGLSITISLVCELIILVVFWRKLGPS